MIQKSDKDPPFLSVIIPTYHSWDSLDLCLDALRKQTLDRENFEIIVINNDPSDTIPSNFELPSNARIIEESKPSSYAARNAGIKESAGEILAFTDSDCIPDKKWLENGMLFLEENKNISIVAGHIELTFEDKDELTMTELYEKEFAFKQENGGTVTANLFTYRNVFDRIGLFNDEMKSGGDTEWSIRAKEEDFKSKYAENVVVYHPARNSLFEFCKKAIRVYPGIYKLKGHNEMNIILKFLYGLYLIKPPIKILRVFLKYDFISSLKIFATEYFRRASCFYSHYKLLFTGKTNRK